jgi:hypothetical protein
MKNRIWQLQFKSQQAIPWLFSLMLPEIAGQKVKISTDLETCDMSDISAKSQNSR